MTSTVAYGQTESVATITLDDGKVNVLSPAMQQTSTRPSTWPRRPRTTARSRPSCWQAIAGVQCRLRPQRLQFRRCGRGARHAFRRVRTVHPAAEFPVPVIMAATGPAIAMGSFLMLSGDHRIGSPSSRCQANEVAIGMVLPISAIEIMRTV